jgi:nicotinate-nucleotide adenylyltransferase
LNIGLFFGSFNPIHIGHLIIANYMHHFGRLDEVWFIVSPQNPFKTHSELLPQKQRLQMVRLAINKKPFLKASDVEFSLPLPSYTVYTLRHLRTTHPNYNFKIIMGSDNLASFNKWMDFEEILQHHQLLVYHRFGHRNIEMENHPNIVFYDAPVLHISATYVRDLIQQKAPISYLVPPEVEEYIADNNCFEGLGEV